MPLIASKYVEKDSTRIFAISEFYAVMKSISTPLGGWGQIITPEFPVGVYKCFRFAYHMFGNTMGSFEVVAQGSQETKFSRAGMKVTQTVLRGKLAPSQTPPSSFRSCWHL